MGTEARKVLQDVSRNLDLSTFMNWFSLVAVLLNILLIMIVWKLVVCLIRFDCGCKFLLLILFWWCLVCYVANAPWALINNCMQVLKTNIVYYFRVPFALTLKARINYDFSCSISILEWKNILRYSWIWVIYLGACEWLSEYGQQYSSV
jgi:hypothetical protein